MKKPKLAAVLREAEPWSIAALDAIVSDHGGPFTAASLAAASANAMAHVGEKHPQESAIIYVARDDSGATHVVVQSPRHMWIERLGD